MMTFDMGHKSMPIEDFSIGKGAKDFVEEVLPMKELMPNCRINRWDLSDAECVQ